MANTTYSSPIPPFEIHVFWPRRTYPAPVRVAVVEIEAASEPAPGSVVASAVNGGRSPAIGSSQRPCCSSLPSSPTGPGEKPPGGAGPMYGGKGGEGGGLGLMGRPWPPADMGAPIPAYAEVTDIDRNRLTFKVEAFDSERKIGEGTHRRAIISLNR